MSLTTESIIIDDDELIDDSLLEAFNNSDFKERSYSKQQITDTNKSINDLNVSALCCDEELDGYDKRTGQKWIYPVNYPVRDYQFNIIRAAILKNTLVSLPTGLGKTFIAAVLMYNFYRWYPLGKIIFTAPTRPLIAQQIEACYNIIAMPPDDTVEMTGGMNVTIRKENWEKKRVFFATPQVVYNDIKSGICPGKKIRCLVIDEAHKAKSNYAYCHIVSTLTDMEHRTYRILALSATPGSRINDVIQVIKNLHIAHLELRSENCIDVAPYCHHRNINTVVVPLCPELSKLRQLYIEILDFYARRLIQMNILKSNVGNLSKGRILMTYKEFQTNNQRHPQRSFIMKELSQLISLFHGLELLVNHGSRVFLNFFDEHPEKMWIQSDDQLTVILERLRDDLGINPLTLDTNVQPDGSIPEVPQNLNFGHPKFMKAREIMENHFRKAKERNEDTRAIVFCEYHETVKLVLCLLLQCRPLIRARAFVGQGASGKRGRGAMPQQQQLRVMQQFRAGACNALVATCVAEEGLDVGSVDLILCFDVATRSPIRLVQRCGRTGRERTGQVHFLVTEGREHQTLLDGMRQRDSLKSKILQSREVQASLYERNPRLVPLGFTPQCQKKYITVKQPLLPHGKKRKNQKKKQSLPNEEPVAISSATNSAAHTSPSHSKTSTENVSPILTPQPRLLSKSTSKSPGKERSKVPEIISSFLSQRKSQISSPNKTTANPSLGSLTTNASPVKKQKAKSKLAPSKKNADIRTLFLTANKPKQCAKLVNEWQGKDMQMSTQLLDLFIDLTIETNTAKTCYICNNFCDCEILRKMRKSRKNQFKTVCNSEPILPDLSLIDAFNAQSIMEYAKSSAKNKEKALQEESLNDIDLMNTSMPVDARKSVQEDNKNDDLHNYSFMPSQFNYDVQETDANPLHNINDVTITCNKGDYNPLYDNNVINKTSVTNDFNTMCINNIDINKTCAKEYRNQINTNNNVKKTSITNSHSSDSSKISIKVDRTIHFDIGDVEDIFADSDENDDVTIIYDSKRDDFTMPSSNFDLGSFDDILQQNNNNSDEKVVSSTTQEPQEQNTDKPQCSNIVTIDLSGDKSPEYTKEYAQPSVGSPSILSGTRKSTTTSPILTTRTRKLGLKRRVNTECSSKKKLDLEKVDADLSNSMLSITQTIDLINTSDYHSRTEHGEDEKTVSPILLTQAERHKKLNNSSNIVENGLDTSIVPKTPSTSSLSLKRKMHEDSISIASPYFDKKQKLDDQREKKQSIQDKIFAVLTSSDLNVNKRFPNDVVDLNFSTTVRLDLKENLTSKTNGKKNNALSLLDKFSYTPKRSQDFTKQTEPIQKLNGKLPKKKRAKNSFIDSEAELSDGDAGSADELSDSSAGSIADFVTDAASPSKEDMHAHYLKSVRSPVKFGAFKIPQLPTKNMNTVLSQFVEQDSYEMDSFCVDSHIGLTQVDEISHLELAEMLLEEERKRKKMSRRAKHAEQNGESPVIRRKNKHVKRPNVISDSEDSS